QTNDEVRSEQVNFLDRSLASLHRALLPQEKSKAEHKEELIKQGRDAGALVVESLNDALQARFPIVLHALPSSSLGERSAESQDHTSEVNVIEFRPNSSMRVVASVSSDGTAKLWELETGKVLRTLPHAAPAGNVSAQQQKRQIADLAFH